MLGRRHGIRIGEAPDRDGQYFHYLAMRLVRAPPPRQAAAAVPPAGDRLGPPDPSTLRPAWRSASSEGMHEDLSDPYPGFGLGALDPLHGYGSIARRPKTSSPGRSGTCTTWLSDCTGTWPSLRTLV